MVIVKTVQIMGIIGDDEWVADATCFVAGLVNADGVTELPDQVHHARTFPSQVVGVVEDDGESVGTAHEEEILQQLEALQAVVTLVAQVVTEDAQLLAGLLDDGLIACSYSSGPSIRRYSGVQGRWRVSAWRLLQHDISGTVPLVQQVFHFSFNSMSRRQVHAVGERW